MTSQSGSDDQNKKNDTIKVKSLHRYPVKGLSAENLEKVTCVKGSPFPFDRAYAIENGPSRFNAKDPKHLPKINFLALMKHERLALLDSKFDEESETLTIFREGRQVAKGNLSTSIGRNMIEQFIAAFMKEELKGPPKIVSAPNHHFADCPAPWSNSPHCPRPWVGPNFPYPPKYYYGQAPLAPTLMLRSPPHREFL